MASGDKAASKSVTMTEAHKKVLRRHHSDIMDNMSPDRIVVLLYQEFVLSPDDKADVQAERTRRAKNGALLDIIERKGDTAFVKFIDALKEDEQPHIAQMLIPPVAPVEQVWTHPVQENPRVATPSRPPVPPKPARPPIPPRPSKDVIDSHMSVQVSTSEASPDGIDSRLAVQVEDISLSSLSDRVMPAADTEGRPLRRNPISLSQLTVMWETIPPYRRRCDVTPTTPDMFDKLRSHLKEDKKIYQTHKAMKGKVCIIALPRFEDPNLHPLEGYDHDQEKLTCLFSSLGFEVRIPYVAERTLSVMEIRSALHAFSQTFTDEDQVAALCVLSHGEEGSVYGSDGKVLPIKDILYSLDNSNCPQMMGKPKIAVIHSCQGDTFDKGSHYVAAADAAASLPQVSDMIICYPTMPGYVSFVSPKTGSLYINNFVDVLSQNAGSTDILDILTTLNNECSERAVKGQPYKQMANYSSCLRKKLYLLPCRNQKDWV